MTSNTTQQVTSPTTSSYSGQTSGTQAPWSVQQPYLANAMEAAYQNYINTLQKGPYTGDTVALDYNGYNQNALNQLYNTGTNKNLINAATQGVNQGGQMAGMGLGAYGQGTGALAGLAGNNTQQIIDGAMSIANSPFISDAVKAAMTDANRNASESQVPNLYRNAASSNNLNSSQAALGQGVVERGLNDLAGNLSATMRQNMYSQGLNTALGQLQNQTSAASNLGSLGINGYNAGAAGQAQGIQNLGALNNMALQGAQGYQQLYQNNLNNQQNKYNNWVNFPNQALQNYYNLIGANSWGNQSTGTTSGTGFQSGGTTSGSTTPSLASILSAALGGGANLFTGGANSAGAGMLGAGGSLLGSLLGAGGMSFLPKGFS